MWKKPTKLRSFSLSLFLLSATPTIIRFQPTKMYPKQQKKIRKLRKSLFNTHGWQFCLIYILTKDQPDFNHTEWWLQIFSSLSFFLSISMVLKIQFNLNQTLWCWTIDWILIVRWLKHNRPKAWHLISVDVKYGAIDIRSC